MPQLHAIAGEDVGRRWEAPERAIHVGRDPSCDVVLDDGRVSRRHCKIEYVAGFYVITNLSSTNGTFVNQVLIDERQLEDQDEISLGGTVLRFMLDDEAARAAQPKAAPALLSPTDPSQSIIFYGEAGQPSSEDVINLTYDKSAFDVSDISAKLDVAEQLKAMGERFEIIRGVVSSIVTELDLDKIFERILDHVFRLVNAERGCVMVYDKATGRCIPRAVRQRGQAQMTEGFPMSRSICDAALKQKMAILSADATSDDRFLKSESIVMQGIRSVMSAPMIFHDEPLGIISVDNRDRVHAFSKRDLETLSVIASLAATAIRNAHSVQEQIHNEITRQNFARFLPPALLRQVTEEGRELRLGGETADVTVLFTDIRSFTPMCASRPAEEIVRLLNVYFHELTGCVFRHRGTLDKYLGDGMLAVFGCPEPYENHCVRAARAAIEMRGILTTHKLLSKEIQVGISLHRGEVIHGFVGSQQRMQYTIIGDTVNTASRLCDVAKGGQILISQSVLDSAYEYLDTKPLPSVHLEGKKEPFARYELLDLTDKGKAFDSRT